MQKIYKRKTKKRQNKLAMLYEYSKHYRLGYISDEKFNALKRELLVDTSWIDEYKNLENKQYKRFFTRAFVSIFMLRELGLITTEEFNFFDKLLELDNE